MHAVKSRVAPWTRERDGVPHKHRLPTLVAIRQISCFTLQPLSPVRSYSLLLLGTLAGAVPALQAQSNLRSAPSTRATAEVVLSVPTAQGQPAGASYRVKVDYGQPHARGRVVEGALKADLDTVWRVGANNPTTFTTETDLVLGGTLTVPKGSYVLWARTPSLGAWKLIVSRDMGATYDRAKDLGSVDLTSRTLTNPIESLTIALVPGPDGAPRGDLRISWGTREFTTTWAVK